MPIYRPHTRQRQRHTRVVDLAPQTAAFGWYWWWDDEAYDGIQVGLDAITMVRDMFPAFYQEHVAPLACTPSRMLGVIAAFYQLVEREGLALRWNDALEEACEADPADTLGAFDDVSLSFLREVGYGIYQIQPWLFGLGISMITTGDRVDPSIDSAAFTLWWIWRGSSFDTGIDLEWLAPNDPVPQLEPLDMPITMPLIDAVARQIPEAAALHEPSDLLLYAVGRTTNELANMSNDEWDERGEEGCDWVFFDRMRNASADARQIAAAFDAWAARFAAELPQSAYDLVALFQQSAAALAELTMQEEVVL